MHGSVPADRPMLTVTTHRTIADAATGVNNSIMSSFGISKRSDFKLSSERAPGGGISTKGVGNTEENTSVPRYSKREFLRNLMRRTPREKETEKGTEKGAEKEIKKETKKEIKKEIGIGIDIGKKEGGIRKHRRYASSASAFMTAGRSASRTNATKILDTSTVGKKP